MAERKAESVLPEPVGAAISVCSRRLMAGQARACVQSAPKTFQEPVADRGMEIFELFHKGSQCTMNETMC